MRLDGMQCEQGPASESDDEPRPQERERGRQVPLAGAKLGAGWRSIPRGVDTPRVAQHRVRDEDLIPPPAGLGQQAVESATALVAAERDAGAVGTEAPGGLAHQHDARIQWAVRRSKDASAALHCGAAPTGLHLGNQIGEGERHGVAWTP